MFFKPMQAIASTVAAFCLAVAPAALNAGTLEQETVGGEPRGRTPLTIRAFGKPLSHQAP